MQDDPPGDRLQPLAVIDLVLVYLVWGSTFLAMRIGVGPGSGVDPWLFGGSRVLVAGLLLLVIAVALKRRIRFPRRDLWTLATAGILIWVGGHGLLLFAVTQADSGYTALFIASFPIWAALYDALLDRRVPGPRLVGALFLGFAGIVVLSLPNLRADAALSPWIMAALLVAPLTWAAGFTLQRRRLKGLGAVEGSAYQHLAAAPVFFVAAFFLRESFPAPTLDASLAWLYLVVFGSLVAYSAAVYAVQHLPARIAETYAYVNPVVAMVLGHLILKEVVGSHALVGAGLVLLGVWGVFHEEGRRTRTAPSGGLEVPPARGGDGSGRRRLGRTRW